MNLTISGCSSPINIGSTCILTASCTDQFGGSIACPTLHWASGNTSIATVSSSGVVQGVSAGTVNIDATDEATGLTSNNIDVTVNPPACVQPSCGFTIIP